MYLERLLLYHAMLYSYMTNTLFSLAKLSLSVSGSPGHFFWLELIQKVKKTEQK